MASDTPLLIARRDFMALGAMALGSAMASRPATAAPDLQNVASRGQAHNGTIMASGTKTRMKGSSRFVVGDGGAVSLQPVFSNFYLFNDAVREHDGAAYLIRKASLQVGAMVVPLLFKGARSVAVAKGEVALMPSAVLPSAFGLGAFPAGTVALVRLAIDLSSRDQPIAAQGNPMYANGESQYLYDAGMEVDDVDATSWTAPVGADLWIPFPHPVMMLGMPGRPVTSLVGIGDSIVDGSSDGAGDGSSGGGWLRRAAYAQSLPYLSISRTGDKAQYVAASHAKTQSLIRLAGAHAGVISLGNNDIRDGRSAAEIAGDIRSISSMLRDCAVSRIAQAQILAETTSSDQASSLSGQTTVPAFAAGSVRDEVNAAVAARSGGLLNDQIDLPSAVQSDGKWNVPAFDGRVTQTAAAGVPSVSLNVMPEIGDFLVFDPATPANQDLNWLHVTEISGAGPFDASLTGGISKAHPAGTPVRASLSADGIHPQQAAHVALARKAAPALRRAAAVRQPWAASTSSFDVDFVNGRAQINGREQPIGALVTCSRSSPGRAFDGISWFDMPADVLRCVDGGGLLIEELRTNEISNTLMAGGQSPRTLPKNWSIFPTEGIEFALSYGLEHGLTFVDVHLFGQAAEAGNTAIDFESGVATKGGETWTHSAFLAVAGGDPGALQSVSIGLRGGASGGSASEFLNGVNLHGTLDRHLTRHHATFTVMNSTTVLANARLNLVVASGTMLDTIIRIAAPQLEKAGTPSSPISTSAMTVKRARDVVSLRLPPGRHRLLLTYMDGSAMTVENASGFYSVPANIEQPGLQSVTATRTD